VSYFAVPAEKAPASNLSHLPRIWDDNTLPAHWVDDFGREEESIPAERSQEVLEKKMLLFFIVL
jgi:hypothetical protein